MIILKVLMTFICIMVLVRLIYLIKASRFRRRMKRLSSGITLKDVFFAAGAPLRITQISYNGCECIYECNELKGVFFGRKQICRFSFVFESNGILSGVDESIIKNDKRNK